jgi:hypothetical protein
MTPDYAIAKAPVTIGGRSLTVRECTFWDLENKVKPFQASAAEPKLVERVFGLLEYFLGHNEGFSREFLERILPANVRRTMEILFAVLEASGLERANPGEAAPAQ